MKKWFYLFCVANVLLCANVFAEPLPIENVYFERPVFSKPTRRERILYASAHSVGAVALAGATLTPIAIGLLGSFVYDSNSPFVAGVIGSGCIFAGGMYATKALGGSRRAVALGCLAGLVTLVALKEERAYVAIPVTAGVAGTIAGLEF